MLKESELLQSFGTKTTSHSYDKLKCRSTSEDFLCFLRLHHLLSQALYVPFIIQYGSWKNTCRIKVGAFQIDKALWGFSCICKERNGVMGLTELRIIDVVGERVGFKREKGKEYREIGQSRTGSK